MAELERITFEQLPKIGESPLEAADILDIMRWAVERRTYIAGLKSGAAKFSPGYEPGAEKALEDCERDYEEIVRGLNEDLGRHFSLDRGARISVAETGDMPEKSMGISESVEDVTTIPSELTEVEGLPVGFFVANATLLIDTGRNAAPHADYVVQFLPLHSPMTRTDYVDMTLEYPAAQRAAA